MKLTWRKEPDEKGLARMCQGPRGFYLYLDGKQTPIHVARIRDGGWYWYGCGKNTAVNPRDTADEAKSDAKAYFQVYLTGNPANRGAG